MEIETVFKALFPDHQFSGDDAALVQIREEVEVLREQIGIRVGDIRRMFAEYARTTPEVGLAGLLWLSRDLTEHTAIVLARGKVPAERNAEELQRAHDVMCEAIMSPALRLAAFDGSDGTLELMKANEDVLCWALGHHHNRTFATNLARIEAELFRRGYIVGPANAESL